MERSDTSPDRKEGRSRREPVCDGMGITILKTGERRSPFGRCGAIVRGIESGIVLGNCAGGYAQNCAENYSGVAVGLCLEQCGELWGKHHGFCGVLCGNYAGIVTGFSKFSVLSTMNYN